MVIETIDQELIWFLRHNGPQKMGFFNDKTIAIIESMLNAGMLGVNSNGEILALPECPYCSGTLRRRNGLDAEALGNYECLKCERGWSVSDHVWHSRFDARSNAVSEDTVYRLLHVYQKTSDGLVQGVVDPNDYAKRVDVLYAAKVN